MLFPTLSVSVLGLAAVASAAPHSRFAKNSIVKRDAIMPVERGLTWTPKKRQSSFEQFASITNFNSFSSNSFQNDFSSFSQETVVVINEFQGNSFAQQELALEQELVQLVQEQLFLLQAQNAIVDNIRSNHFNSQNNNVNTVIVIVQEISDNRGGNKKSRYMSRQINSNSNSNSQEEIVVIIQDSNTISVGGNNNNNNNNNAGLFATGTVASAAQSTGSSDAPPPVSSGSASAASSGEVPPAPVGTYDPNLSSFQGYTPNIDILPASVSSAPSFNFGTQTLDPAVIILANQQAFVEFVDQSKQSQSQSSSSAEIITAITESSNII